MGLRYGYGSEEQRVRPGAAGLPAPQRIRDDLPYDATPAAISLQQQETQARAAEATRMSEENSRMVQKTGENIGAAVQAPVEGFMRGRKAQQEYELGQQRGDIGAEELRAAQMQNQKAKSEAEYGARDAAEQKIEGAIPGETVSQFKQRNEARGTGAQADNAIAQAKTAIFQLDRGEQLLPHEVATAKLQPAQTQASIDASKASTTNSHTQNQLGQAQLADVNRKAAIENTKQGMRQIAKDPKALAAHVEELIKQPGADRNVVIQAAWDAANEHGTQEYYKYMTDPILKDKVDETVGKIRRVREMQGALTALQNTKDYFLKHGTDILEGPGAAAARENLANAFEPFNKSLAQQIRDGVHWKSLTGSGATAEQGFNMIQTLFKGQIAHLAHDPAVNTLPAFQDLVDASNKDNTNVFGGNTTHNAFMNNGPAAQKPPVETLAQRQQRIQNKVNEDESWQNNQVLPPDSKPMTEEERVQKIRAARAKKPTTAGVPNQPSARDIARPTLNQGTGYVEQGGQK